MDNWYWNQNKNSWDYLPTGKNSHHRGVSHPTLNIVLIVIGIVLLCVSVGLGLFYFGLYLAARMSGMI